MTEAASIWLASASPRRRMLLLEAGFGVIVEPSDLDDGRLKRGDVSPGAWVMALAWFKARRVAERILPSTAFVQAESNRFVLAADTICVHEGRLLGQPGDAIEARGMMELMRDSTHTTLTGVCLFDPDPGRRFITFDEATVKMGAISDAAIEEYIGSGHWRGKAGAYNLSERIEAGWPIQCLGDPTTVMGLPMRKLPEWIERFRSFSL